MAINIKKSHRGLLHKDLGVKKGEKIPASKLAIKKTDSPAVKKRKTFALNARKWSHEDGGYIPIAELGYAEKPKPWNPDAITEANYAQRDNTQGVIMLNQDMYGKGNNIVSDIPPGQTPLANNIDPNSQDSNMYKQQAANYDQSQVQPIQQKSQGKGNPLSGKGFALGDVIGGALGVLNKLIPAQQGYDQRPTIETNYNAYSQGTGSGAIYDNGGYLTPLQYNKDLRRESKDYDDGGNVQTYALPKGFQIPEGAKVMKYQNDYDAQGNIIGKSPIFQNYNYQDTTQALRQAGVNKMDYAASQQNFAPNTNSNQWANNHTQNSQPTQNYAQLTPIGNRDVYRDSRINFSVPQVGTNMAMNNKKKNKVHTNSDFNSAALPDLFKDGGNIDDNLSPYQLQQLNQLRSTQSTLQGLTPERVAANKLENAQYPIARNADRNAAEQERRDYYTQQKMKQNYGHDINNDIPISPQNRRVGETMKNQTEMLYNYMPLLDIPAAVGRGVSKLAGEKASAIEMENWLAHQKRPSPDYASMSNEDIVNWHKQDFINNPPPQIPQQVVDNYRNSNKWLQEQMNSNPDFMKQLEFTKYDKKGLTPFVGAKGEAFIDPYKTKFPNNSFTNNDVPDHVIGDYSAINPSTVYDRPNNGLLDDPLDQNEWWKRGQEANTQKYLQNYQNKSPQSILDIGKGKSMGSTDGKFWSPMRQNKYGGKLENGGKINYEAGKEYDLSPTEIKRLKALGYEIE